jgi:subtilisin family serine protease
MPELVGEMIRGGADVAVEHVIPLAGHIKGAGGPEPSAYAPPFPAVVLDEKRAAPVVAVLDTGVSAETRSDGYLAMPVSEDDRDPLDAFPPDGLLDAGAGHGTFVAGIIEQVAPGTPLRVHRVIDSDGLTSEAAVAAGMRRAVREQGAQVLNLSLGSETVDDRAPYVLQQVVEDFADEHPDVLIVCAAGNNGDAEPVWPAALAARHDNVVAVAALDRHGHPARWSSHGDWVRFSAIGEGVVSTYVQGTEDGDLIDDPSPDTYGADSWAAWTGTSFATPQITGAIARIMVESDRELSPRAALDELSARGTDLRTAGYGTGLRILPGT